MWEILSLVDKTMPSNALLLVSTILFAKHNSFAN